MDESAEESKALSFVVSFLRKEGFQMAESALMREFNSKYPVTSEGDGAEHAGKAPKAAVLAEAAAHASISTLEVAPACTNEKAPIVPKGDLRASGSARVPMEPPPPTKFPIAHLALGSPPQPRKSQQDSVSSSPRQLWEPEDDEYDNMDDVGYHRKDVSGQQQFMEEEINRQHEDDNSSEKAFFMHATTGAPFHAPDDDLTDGDASTEEDSDNNDNDGSGSPVLSKVSHSSVSSSRGKCESGDATAPQDNAWDLGPQDIKLTEPVTTPSKAKGPTDEPHPVLSRVESLTSSFMDFDIECEDREEQSGWSGRLSQGEDADPTADGDSNDSIVFTPSGSNVLIDAISGMAQDGGFALFPKRLSMTSQNEDELEALDLGMGQSPPASKAKPNPFASSCNDNLSSGAAEEGPSSRTRSAPLIGVEAPREGGGFSFPVNNAAPAAVQPDARIFKSWASARSSCSGMVRLSDDDITNVTEYADDDYQSYLSSREPSQGHMPRPPSSPDHQDVLLQSQLRGPKGFQVSRNVSTSSQQEDGQQGAMASVAMAAVATSISDTLGVGGVPDTQDTVQDVMSSLADHVAAAAGHPEGLKEAGDNGGDASDEEDLWTSTSLAVVFPTGESAVSNDDLEPFISGDQGVVLTARMRSLSNVLAQAGEPGGVAATIAAAAAAAATATATGGVAWEDGSSAQDGEERASPTHSTVSTAIGPSYSLDEGGNVVYEYDAAYVDRKYEVFDMKVIHRRQRTGFEETKDFPIRLDDLIAGRYQVMDFLGSAAFSRAVQALDVKTGTLVCLKIIKNNKDYFDQSLDEIKLLKYVNTMDPTDQQGLVRLYDYFYYKEHLFLVCELLRANLYEFQKYNRESNDEPYFINARIQRIALSVLRSLAFMHSLGLVHSDLKPENILIKSYSRCEVKVIDLGSSCFITDQLSSYVQSRSYRAPEVILGLPYDQKVDVWSLGCILAELSSGYVLFQNDSLATLLARLEGLLGPVPSWMVQRGRYAPRYYTRSGQIYERSATTERFEVLSPKRAALRHRMPEADNGLLSFVAHLLSVDPHLRPTALEALSHPWLQQAYASLDGK